MSVIITNQPSSIEFLFSSGERKILDKSNLNIKEANSAFNKAVYVSNSPSFTQSPLNDVLKLSYRTVTSPSVVSNQALIDLLIEYKNTYMEDNGSIRVTLQDQTTPTVITKMSILEESTTTTAAIAVGDTVIPFTSVTGVTAGKCLAIFDPASIRFSNAHVISVDTLNVTIDRPIDFAYPSGSYIDVVETNLAVVGSLASPVIAGVRNNAGESPPPGIELTMDVTRILFYCEGTSAMNLTTFGNISRLTNGITLRRRDGLYHNIFNLKSNSEFKSIMYDFSIVESTIPSQGEDAFFGRLTFSGQEKMGVTIRLAIDEDLEMFIQDDLSALTNFQVVVEGSIVQP